MDSRLHREFFPLQVPAVKCEGKVPGNAVRSAVIKVLLVDDHAVVREGYRRLLERAGDIQVVGEATDASSAVQSCATLGPRVTVMDISLPDCSGIEATRRILAEQPDARVLVFSMHEDSIYARRALQAGARGYLTKGSAPEDLVDAVRRVAAGERYLDPVMARELALDNLAATGGGPDALSPREFEILRLLARGHSVREIAERLDVNPKTVANQQSLIRQKLGAETPLQLLKAAARLGLVEEP